MKKAFHVVYTLLALNFFIPVLIYIFDPEQAIKSFTDINVIFGITDYSHSEDSVIWRVLAIANVTTLGFCCVLLQVNLKKWFLCLVPLVFLKGMASLGFLVAYFFEPYPLYLAGFLLDGVTVFLMWFFATRAYKQITA